jgi:glutamate synthase domain-containing protein 1
MLTAPIAQGLYDPQFEHDACGVGFIAHVKGRKSHAILRDALSALVKLNHRGACGCEANTGDGAGILLQTPHEFLQAAAAKAKFSLPGFKEYGVGQLFLPQDAKQRAECESIFEDRGRSDHPGLAHGSNREHVPGQHGPGERALRAPGVHWPQCEARGRHGV